MPSVLQEKKWDCPDAVELNQWTKIFRAKPAQSHLQTLSAGLSTKDTRSLLVVISNLRHTAVHRLPTTAKGVSRLLESAVKFTQILQDNFRAAQLEELLSDVNSKLTAMELNKNVLEDTLSLILE